MKNERFRELSRQFDAVPNIDTALELAQVASREGFTAKAESIYNWILDIHIWDQLDPEEQLAAMEILSLWSTQVGFNFLDLYRFTQNNITREIAFFEDAEQHKFALIPGGTVKIGFEQKTLDPSEINAEFDERIERAKNRASDKGDSEIEEELSWIENVRAASFDWVRRLKPLRTVNIKPLFVETTPGRIAGLNISHKAVVEALSREGYRLLKSDEWEYCCAAGSKTLFRWGNQFPRGENSECALAPNAFGLHFHASPAGPEYCLEEHVLRNGDGGNAISGGAGLVGYLPLSPWYERRSRNSPGFSRRVFDLDQCFKQC